MLNNKQSKGRRPTIAAKSNYTLKWVFSDFAVNNKGKGGRTVLLVYLVV